MSCDSYDKMEDLMRRLDIGTKKEMFTTALSLLNWVTDEISEGREIASIDQDSKNIYLLVNHYTQHLKDELKRKKKESA